MSDEFTVKKSVRINAGIAVVWEALTNPQITKQYFFNCEAISDWKAGSPLLFNTMVEGKEMTVVKGIITAIEPPSLLEHSCFTPATEDDPTQHTTATYRLTSAGDVTTVSITQGRFHDEETTAHTRESWDKVLGGLKAVVEDGI